MVDDCWLKYSRNTQLMVQIEDVKPWEALAITVLVVTALSITVLSLTVLFFTSVGIVMTAMKMRTVMRMRTAMKMRTAMRMRKMKPGSPR